MAIGSSSKSAYKKSIQLLPNSLCVDCQYLHKALNEAFPFSISFSGPDASYLVDGWQLVDGGKQ